MNKIAEEAHERIHHASHGDGHGEEHSNSIAKRVAILVSVLAAVLALTEVGAKSTQNEYLKNHIAVSDDYAYYQARTLRALMKETEARIMARLPSADDPKVQEDIKADLAYSDRMKDDPKSGDGMKQLLEKAKVLEEEREHALHHYHFYELSGGALEIAIVLASVAVVTDFTVLAVIAGAIGGVAGLVSLVVAMGFV
jgi:hypothetical protein